MGFREVTNKAVLLTRGSNGRQNTVFLPFSLKENRLCRKGELSTACHRIVMSHSNRAPGPIQFKICQKTTAIGKDVCSTS